MQVEEKEDDAEGTEIVASDGQATEKFLIFTVLGKFYTFQTKIISEVTAFDRAYPLPLVPQYVIGLINRYSAPFALLDLGMLIQESPTPKSKVVVIKETIDKLAFLIDDVVDIVDVPVSAVMKIEQGTGETGIIGILESSFEWKGNNVFVLGMRQILERIREDFD
jgi:purine-binding chemotaxis protein CheW